MNVMPEEIFDHLPVGNISIADLLAMNCAGPHDSIQVTVTQ